MLHFTVGRNILLGILSIFYINPSYSAPGKLVLIRNGEEIEVDTKTCKSGLYLKKPMTYQCACVTGVWAFYEGYCEKPVMIVAGTDYCFRIDKIKLRQVANIGSPTSPFMPSLSHFQDSDYSVQTSLITQAEPVHQLHLDALGGLLSVTNTWWTLYNDKKNESICLGFVQKVSPNSFCKYHSQLQAATKLNSNGWTIITRVRTGCHSDRVIRPDMCFPIRKGNGIAGCSLPPKTEPCPDSPSLIFQNGTNSSTNGTVDAACNPEPVKEDLKGRSSDFDGYLPFPITGLKGRGNDNLGPDAFGNKSSEVNCSPITHETVKQYWLDPANNECSRSFTEAMFKDQLRRFAVTRFNSMFDSRLKSLEQMNQILYLTKDILKKTCGREYLPPEFLDVAADAFFMFVQEDFFYGVPSIDPDSFDRIVKSLTKCWKSAKLFTFETDPLNCDIRKIKGTLPTADNTSDTAIPLHGKSKNFEVLIEASWKIFLNAHSYCYEDFLVNDHHLFSKQFMGLFSRSIYEKWIQPLKNKELYKFILPHYKLMHDIMDNIDHCVAATGKVCPVWLTRTSTVLPSNDINNKKEPVKETAKAPPKKKPAKTKLRKRTIKAPPQNETLSENGTIKASSANETDKPSLKNETVEASPGNETGKTSPKNETFEISPENKAVEASLKNESDNKITPEKGNLLTVHNSANDKLPSQTPKNNTAAGKIPQKIKKKRPAEQKIRVKRKGESRKEDGTVKSGTNHKSKRSTWTQNQASARDRAKHWSTDGYCLQRMEEPASKLFVSNCKQVY